jgi:hypothetical protein
MAGEQGKIRAVWQRRKGCAGENGQSYCATILNMNRYVMALGLGAAGMLGGWGRAAEVAPGQAGLPPILLKIFENVAAFSAKAELTLSSAKPAESMQMPMDFFFLEGNMRAEVDMANVKSEALPEEMVQSLKQIGMDRMVTIMRSGDHPAWVLYPHLKAYLEVPGAETLSSDSSAKSGVRETKLGTETVGGLMCDKYRFVLGESRDGAQAQEATVWRARDLGRFPVRIQMSHSGATMAVSFRNINLKTPSADKFRLPPGYKKRESMETLMREAVKRLLEGGQSPKSG